MVWANDQIPILNGAIYPDGRWIPFVHIGNEVRMGQCRLWNEEDCAENLTHFTELARASVAESSLDVVAGEGSLGSDGVIALVDRLTNKLHWVLFSENSNPFVCIDISQDQIEATTNLGTVWSFQMADQTSITIR